MKTRSIKKDEVDLKWYIVDAKGIRLGKLATTVARMLQGKDKVKKTTNMPNGDAVIVINSKLVDVFPKKLKQKIYYRHSGFIGGLKERNLEEMLEKFPNRVIEKAVRGMLPKNKLGDSFYRNLHVVDDTQHKYEAQKPIKLEVK